MNKIEEIRTEIEKYLEASKVDNTSHQLIISPSGKFRLETINYHQTKPGCNWDVTRVEIFTTKSGDKIFDFFTNDGSFFYSWLIKNNCEYLICAEDLFGGQTVIDLTNQKMQSYSSNEDGFIHSDFHFSPDGNILAVIGCYWACPFIIKLFDFTNPFNLPFREIKEIELLGNDEIITGWIDNENFKTNGIERVKKSEYFEDGSTRQKIVSETPVERIINVSGNSRLNYI